jgi:hypothetical protein
MEWTAAGRFFVAHGPLKNRCPGSRVSLAPRQVFHIVPGPEVMHAATSRNPSLCVDCGRQSLKRNRVYGVGDGSLYRCVRCTRKVANSY